MANYFLFLDELKANDIYSNFCMGGIFVEEVHYRKQIVPQMNRHKNNILGNTGKILHENELSDLLSKYKENKKIQKSKQIYDAMRDLIINYDTHTICVGITKDNLLTHYPNSSVLYNKYRLYNVALQIVMENYAHFLEEAGCFALVLEKIPAELAARVASELTIPVIGIGAGGAVDGQVLVVADMLGMTKGFSPRFLRRYADLHTMMTDAIGQYVADVKACDFPNESEQY